MPTLSRKSTRNGIIQYTSCVCLLPGPFRSTQCLVYSGCLVVRVRVCVTRRGLISHCCDVFLFTIILRNQEATRVYPASGKSFIVGKWRMEGKKGILALISSVWFSAWGLLHFDPFSYSTYSTSATIPLLNVARLL